MKALIELLLKLDFTQYEAQVLSALIKYNNLSARELNKYSGVPQPKIYDTTLRLEKKGLIDITLQANKKMYIIKPKTKLEEYINNYTETIQTFGDKSKKLISNMYNTEQSKEISFIGIAGREHIQEKLCSLIKAADEKICGFCSPIDCNDEIISHLNRVKKNVELQIIFKNKKMAQKYSQKIRKGKVYYLKLPIFNILNSLGINLITHLKEIPDNDFPAKTLENFLNKIEEKFSIIMVDERVSLCKIPIPIDIPMAVYGSLPKMIQFHKRSINFIIKNSQLL